MFGRPFQYFGLASRMMSLWGDQRRSLYGPVPTGVTLAPALTRSWPSKWCFGRMPKMNDATSGPYGCLYLTTTVLASLAVTFSTEARYADQIDDRDLRAASTVKTTSLAVKGLPSCQVTSFRR